MLVVYRALTASIKTNSIIIWYWWPFNNFPVCCIPCLNTSGFSALGQLAQAPVDGTAAHIEFLDDFDPVDLFIG